MKKNFYSLFFMVALLCGQKISAQVFSISSNSGPLCINSTAYAYVSTGLPTAANYSWTATGISGNTCTGVPSLGPNGSYVYINYPCSGAYQITCAGYSSVNAFIAATSITVTVGASTATTPSITASPNGTMCSGSSLTLSAMGGVNYTWVPINVVGANAVVSASANTCYTLWAQNASGCVSSTTVCPNVVPVYTPAVTGVTAICLGSSTTLSLSGGPSFITNPGNINSANPVLTPTVSTLYTITCPAGAFACPNSINIPIIVNPQPTINVVASPSTTNNSICFGQSKVLVATMSGGTTYTWSTGANTQSIMVTPLANTCYSVVGSNNTTGCTNLAVYCITVMPLPTLAVSGGFSVCQGSAMTYSASGALTYSWSTSPQAFTSTVSIIQQQPYQQYTLTGTGANGCSAIYTVGLFSDSLCAIVWPGDANRDGVANTNDVLELGLQAGATGATRSGATTAWTGQQATAWVGHISTGWNKVHADCNGDGVVNSSDNTAITANFALTHAFKETQSTSGSPEISLIPTQLNAYEGVWNKADIVLGDASNPLNQLYGVAFDVNYDQAMVIPDSVKILYTASFLNANNQNIDFGKTIYANGKLYAATVRVDHTNKNGTGKIGEFWYKVKTGLPSNSIINLSISSAKKVSATAVSNTLSAAASQSLAISASVVNILNNSGFENLVSFFPNPTNKVLNLRSELGAKINYAIYDLTGREILKGDFIQSKSIELNNLAKGAYFVRFVYNGQVSNKQLLIEN